MANQKRGKGHFEIILQIKGGPIGGMCSISRRKHCGGY